VNIYNDPYIRKAGLFGGKRPEIRGILFTRGPTNAIYKPMPATLTRDQMRIYQRERRARLKVEREGDEPVVDVAIPRNAPLKAGEGELATVRAKIVAIGPRAIITKTHGRLDVLRRDASEARHPSTGSGSPSASPSRPVSPSPSRSVAPAMPAPRSMVADGGRPADRSGFGSVATETAAFRANVTASLNRLAQEAVEAKREREAQQRRIAALEAAADRRADAIDVVQAIAGLFSYAVRR
jgi:hypothetical protein